MVSRDLSPGYAPESDGISHIKLYQTFTLLSKERTTVFLRVQDGGIDLETGHFYNLDSFGSKYIAINIMEVGFVRC
jgi:hypothetical protein